MGRVTNQLRRAGVAVASVSIALSLSLGPVVPAIAYTEHDVYVSQGHGTITPEYLVIHETANPGATAANHVSYWRNNQPNVSMTQWVIDWTDGGTVYQVQPGNTKAWHVGAKLNSKSVGIEICHATNQADFDVVFEQAARWAADYLQSKGWGVDRMISHADVSERWGGTDHMDPRSYFESYGQSWASFKQRVAEYLSGETSEPVTPDTSDDRDINLGADWGWTGPRMVSELQRQLGTPVDGELWGQARSNNVRTRRVESRVKRYGASGSAVVKQLQRELIADGYSCGSSGADGHMGRDTVKALQRWLTDHGYSVGDSGADGYYGADTSHAVAEALMDEAFA